MNIYKLLKSKEKIEGQLGLVAGEIQELKSQIRLSKDPMYVENQAVDRFDLVEESDLVFIFPEL